MPFVFYDTETTGVETGFDQILQFAAIKTDYDFNEIDRFNIRCRLLPYVVPAPMAMKVTGVTADMLTDPALPSHFEAMQQIHAKIAEWSPATFIGYNTLDFDEELLRQGFYRSLLPLYPTSMGGNSRGDVFQLARAASAYYPDLLNFPRGDKGQIVLKLDQLAPANGFDHRGAHEALSDVEATIFIARTIRDNVPDLWASMMEATNKQAVAKRLHTEKPVVYSPYYFGRAYHFLVAPCGVNANYDSQIGVFDLTFDPVDIMDCSVAELIEHLGAKKKPIRAVKANAQPILMPGNSPIGESIANGIGAQELARRVAAITENQDFHQRVGEALAGRFEDEEPSPHVEDRIYGGFFSPQDSQRMRRFQTADWAARSRIIEELEDERLREQGARLLYAENPEALSPNRRAEMEAWVADRIMTQDDDLPWLTVPKAIADADELLADANPGDRQLLTGIKEYLEGLARRYGP